MIFLHQLIHYTFITLFTCISVVASASDKWDQNMVSQATNQKIIYVDKAGCGDFTKIQEAIDSVRSNNTQWVVIFVKAGIYREDVLIPADKPFIILKGEDRSTTHIIGNKHRNILESTFKSLADNFLAKQISFVNTYNIRGNKYPRKVAVAAIIKGDKSAFYQCNFVSVQDTLADYEGRHYFYDCLIQGTVDFIFGNGQSYYENCTILSLNSGAITAQGRIDPKSDTGYVFHKCNVGGYGKTILGRPWRPYARVLFHKSYFDNIIHPRGWDSWKQQNLSGISFSEYDCYGPGANTSKRPKWLKALDEGTLQHLSNKTSFIDQDGWISQQPRV